MEVKEGLMRYKDRTGIKYGKLLVIKFVKSLLVNKRRTIIWQCKCDCGKIKNFRTPHLVSGATKSCGCILKKPKGHAGLVEFFYSYKSGAKNRNIDFNLSLEEFKKITSKNCNYCNCEPNKRYIHKRKNRSKEQIEHISYFGNGIDRVDNNKGYILTNCVPCCVKCNRMKLDGSLKDFLNHISKIYNFKALNE